MMTFRGKDIVPVIDGLLGRTDLDCVAFVREFYAAFGVELPDPRVDVVAFRFAFDWVLDPAPGDLAQLDFGKGDTRHVGIYVGDGIARGTTDGVVVLDRGLKVHRYFRPREDV